MVNLHWQKLSPDFQWGEVLDDVVKIHVVSYSHFHTFQQRKTSFLLSSFQLATSDTYESKYPRQGTSLKPSFLSCSYMSMTDCYFSLMRWTGLCCRPLQDHVCIFPSDFQSLSWLQFLWQADSWLFLRVLASASKVSKSFIALP